MLLTGCDDQLMEWGKPADHADVTSSEIPLAVKEVIANYDNIKDYAQQYTPDMLIGIGMGADLYINNANGEGNLANANYQVLTPGNAMKNDAIMGNSGSLNFATVDKLIAALDGNMKLYGHNFFWHTQQNQTYLKSLIAPTLVVESDGDIANVLSGSDPLVPEGYGQQCSVCRFLELYAHSEGRHLPTVPVQHGILLCDSGSHHVDSGADPGAAAQQPRSEGQGHLPHHDLPALRYLSGFLLHDF